MEVLARVDALVLLSTYPAGEKPIEGAQCQDLFNSLRERSLPPSKCLARTPEDAVDALQLLIRKDDVVLVQGAGNVNRITAHLTAGSHGTQEQAR